MKAVEGTGGETPWTVCGITRASRHQRGQRKVNSIPRKPRLPVPQFPRLKTRCIPLAPRIQARASPRPLEPWRRAAVARRVRAPPGGGRGRGGPGRAVEACPPACLCGGNHRVSAEGGTATSSTATLSYV